MFMFVDTNDVNKFGKAIFMFVDTNDELISLIRQCLCFLIRTMLISLV